MQNAFALVLGTALSLALATPARAAEQRGYVLATATVGGTYYPAGVALATLINVRLQAAHQIGAVAINSAGSGENIRLLRENAAQLALITALDGHQAWAGKGSFDIAGPQTGLRSIAALWSKVEHFVVRRTYAETGTIEDLHALRGQPVSLGLRGSGALASNRFLLGNLGIDVDADLKLVYLGFEDSARALHKGQIEAMSVPGGIPVAAVGQAMRVLGDQLVILEFTDAQLAAVDGDRGLWSRHVIAAGTYPAQPDDLDTIATVDLLAVREDVDEDAVYRITGTIFENLRFLQTVHKAFADTGLDGALTGLPIPLHPGALRYYREAGVEIPDRLLPP